MDYDVFERRLDEAMHIIEHDNPQNALAVLQELKAMLAKEVAPAPMDAEAEGMPMMVGEDEDTTEPKV